MHMTDKNTELKPRPEEVSDNSDQRSLSDNSKDLYGSLPQLTKSESSKPTPDWLPSANSLLSNDGSSVNILNRLNGDKNGLDNIDGKKVDRDRIVGPKIGEGDTRSPEQRRQDDAKKAADILGKRADLGNKYQREQIELMYKRAYNEGGQEAVDKLTEEINKQLENKGSDVRIDSKTKAVLKDDDGRLKFQDEISLNVTQGGEKTDEATIDMSSDDDDDQGDDVKRRRRYLDGK
jgi:hypothetical protein